MAGEVANRDENEDELAEPTPAIDQPSLFPADRLHELPRELMAREVALRTPRGPGRPPGRANNRTIAWQKLILSKYRSPLIGLVETYSRPVEDLARQLRCTLLEAYDLQLKAMGDAAPYLHSKMPVEVHVEGELPRVYLVDPKAWLALHGAQEIDGHAVDLSKVKAVTDQTLSEPEAEPVERGKLNAQQNGQADQSVSDGKPLITDQRAEPDGGKQ